MTAPSQSVRYDADNARRRRKRGTARLLRDIERAKETAAVVQAATRALRQQQIRRVRVGNTVVPLGALAGTDKPHSFVPDAWSATSCQICFGWSDDTRHLGSRTVAAS